MKKCVFFFSFCDFGGTKIHTQAILRDKKTGASQKMDRSKKGPPEVPHREGALGDLWGTDF